MGRARPQRRRAERLHDEGSGKQVNIEGMLTREGQKCTCDDHVAIGHVCETHTRAERQRILRCWVLAQRARSR